MSYNLSMLEADLSKPAPRPERSRFGLALADVAEGLRRWELWGTLGWHDIRQRYRRSVLGPFWISISMGAMVGGLSLLWSTLFQQSIPRYLPHFALGYITWTFLQTLILEGCTAFYGFDSIIKQIPVPLSVHIYRTVWRNLIIAAHNMTIYVVIIAGIGIWPGLGLLTGLLGYALLSVFGVAAALIVGILSARFRDIPPILGSVLQMIFFFSPILWLPEALPPEHRYLVTYNPLYYMIEVVRQPLLGQALPPMFWLIAASITAITCLVALALFARFRKRIAYWV